MLNYAEENVRSRTIIPIEFLPCHPFHSYATVSSYAIGPIDLAQVAPLHAHLSTDEKCLLLIPIHLPPSLLAHPMFQEGSEWGYLESHVEEEEWTVPKLINEVYDLLSDLYDEPDDPNFFPWTLGFVLGELTRVADRDRTLALTGLAHYCFLLPLFTQARPTTWPRYEPYHARILHDRAVKAYRARVRVYKGQGKSFDEAQRLALAA